MSGDHKRLGGWMLPVIVVAIGAYFLATAVRQGTLKPVELHPVNWIGLAAMLAGLIFSFAFKRSQRMRLLGLLVCGIGAIMVICA